ncbi:MAG: S1C family serine protease [Acidimicrobiales bacterium]
MGALEEIGAAARAVLDQVGEAVVSVGRDGRGSGVVTAAGVVVTNAHNVRGAELTVVFGDGASAAGAVAGFDTDGDLAVVKVDTGGRRPVGWAPAAQSAAVGNPVFALAGGRGGAPSITFGLVSGVQRSFRSPRGRKVTGSVEHTAPLPRGASGGPVVDPSGLLVAVNTHRLDGGFYLAQPADAALQARVDALAEGRSPARPTLGVGLVPAPMAARLRRSVGLPEREGALVRVVAEGGPAAAAGVREGDLIGAAGGSPGATADDLHAALDGLGDAATLTLRVVRGTAETDLTVSFPTG